MDGSLIKDLVSIFVDMSKLICPKMYFVQVQQGGGGKGIVSIKSTLKKQSHFLVLTHSFNKPIVNKVHEIV